MTERRRAHPRALGVLGALVVAGACTALDDQRTAPAAPAGAPLLAAEFGIVLLVEGVVTLEPRKGGDATLLTVQRVNGAPLATPATIHCSYGGPLAEHAAEHGRNGFTVLADRRYQLRGYETGSWLGVVDGVAPRRPGANDFDDFSPALVQAPRFHFENVFRIVDGEPAPAAQR